GLEIFGFVFLEGLAVVSLHQRHAEHVDAVALSRAVGVEHERAGNILVLVLLLVLLRFRLCFRLRHRRQLPRGVSAGLYTARLEFVASHTRRGLAWQRLGRFQRIGVVVVSPKWASESRAVASIAEP